VSGSTIPAENGELVFLVGGDRELYERCLALFEPLAKATFFMGDSGAGATSKLVDTVPVALQPKIEHLKGDEYPTQFALRLMHKDFALTADLARAHGVFMPAASAAAQVNAAEQNRDDEEDFSAVARLTANLSSVRPSS
jgi:3-hydroxyisobutyrate dehydrogenase-like beta-hydroxyacid dehydrogenase